MKNTIIIQRLVILLSLSIMGLSGPLYGMEYTMGLVPLVYEYESKDIIESKTDDETDSATTLLKAAGKGNVSTSERLLKDGASIDFEDENENTALMIAAYEGHEKVVKLLLDAGANVNHQNKNGNTALMEVSSWILNCWISQKKVVKLLLAAGASVDLENKYGATAEMFARVNGHEKIIGLLAVT